MAWYKEPAAELFLMAATRVPYPFSIVLYNFRASYHSIV